MRPPFRMALTLPLTLLILVVEVASVVAGGWGHLLWFSHLGMMGCLVVLWTGSALVASMVAVGILLPEIGWILDLAVGLAIGSSPTGATDYMFRDGIAAHLLSLFHLLLPPLILALLARTGYDRRALPAQTAVAWIAMPLAWLHGPEANIDWTWGLGDGERFGLAPGLWLPLWMAGYAAVVHVPAHLLLSAWDRRRRKKAPGDGQPSMTGKGGEARERGARHDRL